MPQPRRLEPVVPMQFRGTGLFTAAPSRLTLCAPGKPGLWFARADLPGEPRCPATIDSLSHLPVHPAFVAMPARTTNLQTARGDLIATVEHILSALDGMGITDALLELDAPEVPFMDCSALTFAQMVEHTDPSDEGPLEVATLSRVIEVRDERDPDVWIRATPRATPGRSFRYDLDYTRLGGQLAGPLAADAAGLGQQSATWDGTPEAYLEEIAPARTFCLKAEAHALRHAGLLAHLTDQDALVIGPAGPINNEYRVPDEPARHKLLDLVGDLALIGRRVQMDVHARRSGHALNHAMARAIRDAIVPGANGLMA